MKKGLIFLIVAGLVACKTNAPLFIPENPDLQREIQTQDSIFFDAYNNCKISQMDSMFPDDIEFYHDRGGLSTSKPDLMKALENNICNKVRRELLTGSIEVYPIPGYGAVEMGMHRFHNLVEKSTSRYSKFVHTWKTENGNWKLARVISLH